MWREENGVGIFTFSLYRQKGRLAKQAQVKQGENEQLGLGLTY
jgi:hypothetical protein